MIKMNKIIKIILTAACIFMFLLVVAGCYDVPTLGEAYFNQESYEESVNEWFVVNLLDWLELEGLSIEGKVLTSDDIIEESEREARRKAAQELRDFYDFLNMVYHEGGRPNYSADDLSVFQGLGEYSEYIEDSNVNLLETSESSEQESSGTETIVEEQTQENLSTYQDQVSEEILLTVNVDDSTDQVNGSIDFDGYLSEDYHRTYSLGFDSTLGSDKSFEAIASGNTYANGEPEWYGWESEVQGKISEDGNSISGTIYDTILENTFEFSAKKVSSIKEETISIKRSITLSGTIGGSQHDYPFSMTIDLVSGVVTGSLWWEGTLNVPFQEINEQTGEVIKEYTLACPVKYGGTLTSGKMDLATRKINAAFSGKISGVATEGDCTKSPDTDISFTMSGTLSEDNTIASGTTSDGYGWTVYK
jgi:hypothetical protein